VQAAVMVLPRQAGAVENTGSLSKIIKISGGELMEDVIKENFKMDKIELANDYLSKGYFADMTAEQIKAEISKMEAETSRADKRTYNGKMTRIFNNCEIAIANIILDAMSIRPHSGA